MRETLPAAMKTEGIKILVVDDSMVAAMSLTHILESEPGLKVMGTARDGRSAVEYVRCQRPDLVLMDLHMPGMDGGEATRSIMQTNPVPVVICSSVSVPEEMITIFRVLECGALACVEKPLGNGSVEDGRKVASLLRTIRLMAEVKVVRRWNPDRWRTMRADPVEVVSGGNEPAYQVVGIGASTGGPAVLKAILSGLPSSFPLPVVVVQHIATGFVKGLAEWLDAATSLDVVVAGDGNVLAPGRVYLAPEGRQMAVTRGGGIILADAPAENGWKPSVAHLFRSLRLVYGSASIGVLLTGMGRDGAEELKKLRECGAATVVQHRETCVVNGMPGEAIALGAAMYVLTPGGIVDVLASLARMNTMKGVRS